MILFLLSFVAGMLTALAPCVLPLLPVIIGGSLGGKQSQRSRPYIIVGSLALSLAVFTLVLKASTALVHVPEYTWTYLSGGIVIALGLTSLFPGLWESLVIRLNWQAASQRFLGKGTANHQPVAGPVLTGIALGPVFSSCSPTYAFILATVLPRNVAQGLVYVGAYIAGLVVVMLTVALLGRRFILRFAWAVNPRSVFRRSVGLVFILVGLAIVLGLDTRAETWLANHSVFDSTRIEQRLFDSTNKKGATRMSEDDSQLFNVDATPAPELVGITAWINSDPLTIKELRGKVVLVDFWTYSCINCVRTLPYVEKWYQTYKDKGFVVIGVHAPEFAFEHDEANVRKAVQDRHVTYPVAMDNDYATWNNYSNQYWPAHYLIDKQGNIRRVHFGEGEYDQTERAIQKLLGDEGPLTADAGNVPSRSDMTPETYFGTGRESGYVGDPALSNGTETYTAQPKLPKNNWSLGGKWQVADDKITSQSATSTLSFRVSAKDVYVVASQAKAGEQQLKVTSDADGTWYGKDDPAGMLMVNGATLYHIASFGSFTDATLTLTVPEGVSLHTFTFGG